MRCPFCQHADTDVLDTRKLHDGGAIRRRRRCRVCQRRFTTYERVELNLTVLKKNGEREPYEREKLARGIRTACYRRPVSAQRIEQLVNDVETVLIEMDGDEIRSSTIGDQAIYFLRELDEVAYIRFASVYLSFANIKKLHEAVQELVSDQTNEDHDGVQHYDNR